MAHEKVSTLTYLKVFAALAILTVLTVVASRLPLGEPWHTLLALSIATVKAALVLLFFMHVLYSSRLTWIVALGSIAWLAILIGLTFNDYLTRHWDPWQPTMKAIETARARRVSEPAATVGLST